MTTLNLGKDLYLKGRIGWRGLSKEEYLEHSNYKIINATSLMDGYIDWSTCGYISKDRYDESEEIMLKENDILISKDGTLGKIGFVKNLNGCCTVSSGIFVLRNTKPDIVDFNYLFHILKSNIFKDFIHRNKAQGSTIPHLYQRDLESFEIELPDITEQKFVAHILDSIDNQIKRNNDLVQKLQVLGKTIYSKNLDFSNKEKLASKAIITTGKEDANHASINGKYKFFTCSDDVLSCDDFKFEGKSVLVAGNGNFNVKYYEGKFNAYQRTYVIRNDSIIGNLYYTLLFNTEVFRKKSNGSIIKFITIEMLNNIDIPQFSKETNHLLNKILFKINIVDDNTYRLKQLKNKLLPLLINGQLQ